MHKSEPKVQFPNEPTLTHKLLKENGIVEKQPTLAVAGFFACALWFADFYLFHYNEKLSQNAETYLSTE